MEVCYAKHGTKEAGNITYEVTLEFEGVDNTHSAKLGTIRRSTVAAEGMEIPCWELGATKHVPRGEQQPIKRATLAQVKRELESRLFGKLVVEREAPTG